MKTRRTFIKMTGSTTFSALAFPAAISSVDNLFGTSASDKPVRIGIIGAENSHTVEYGKVFNIEKKFPGVEVLYVWGETEEFAKIAMRDGKIPNMVQDPVEMLGKIDALIVDHRHAKYHLEAALPFVKAGIPVFIDKPFCYRAKEGKEFLALARESGTPVTSYSAYAHNEGVFDMKRQVEEIGRINNVVCYGPGDLDSPWGGIFFYGVHSVQPVMYIFGEDIEKVRFTRDGNKGSASLAFGSGLFVTLIFRRLTFGLNIFFETNNGVFELRSRVQEPDPDRSYRDMVSMFRTGEKPRTDQSMLNCVSVLEALEESASTGNWVHVNYVKV